MQYVLVQFIVYFYIHFKYERLAEQEAVSGCEVRSLVDQMMPVSVFCPLLLSDSSASFTHITHPFLKVRSRLLITLF